MYTVQPGGSNQLRIAVGQAPAIYARQETNYPVQGMTQPPVYTTQAPGTAGGPQPVNSKLLV